MKTVADKLLIKPGAALWLSPQEHLIRLGPLPGGFWTSCVCPLKPGEAQFTGGK